MFPAGGGRKIGMFPARGGRKMGMSPLAGGSNSVYEPRLATMFTLTAMMNTLKKNAITPCSSTMRRR
jgi:hypothetical protein